MTVGREFIHIWSFFSTLSRVKISFCDISPLLFFVGFENAEYSQRFDKSRLEKVNNVVEHERDYYYIF